MDMIVSKGGLFLAQLILARILGPKEFGLIGMIVIFVAIGTSLVDSGLSASLIRTENVNDKDFSTIFLTSLFISLIVYAIIFMVAPLIAVFYKQDILVPILRFYCLSFIISSFSTVQISLLIKSMQFRKLMLLNMPGTVGGISIGLFMGFNGYGIWSIVSMYLFIQFFQSLLLWTFSDWKPSFYFSFKKLNTHVNFGYKLMLSGILNTIFNNIYNVIIGRYFPVQLLGYYERAYAFTQYPVTTMTGIISRVSYPLFVELREKKLEMKRIYKKIQQIAFFISTPMLLILAAMAKPLFLLILGAKWIPAVPLFQILCLSSIFYPLHAFNINLLTTFGRSDLFLKLEIVKKIIILLSIVIAFPFGIYGLVWSTVFISIITLIINTYYSRTLINYSFFDQLKDNIKTLVISIITALLVFLTVTFLSFYSLVSQILLGIVVAFFLYLLLSSYLKSKPYIYLFMIIEKRKKLFKF